MTTKKPNPPSIRDVEALAQAKQMREEAYAYKAKRVRSMHEQGVPKSEIIAALGVSWNWIQKVLKGEVP